jgi:hypothetical protein
VAGCLYLAGAANSIHVLSGHIHHGHHIYRATGSLVIGVALLVGAWFAARAAKRRAA